jgi:hypothetical protein
MNLMILSFLTGYKELQRIIVIHCFRKNKYQDSQESRRQDVVWGGVNLKRGWDL